MNEPPEERLLRAVAFSLQWGGFGLVVWAIGRTFGAW